METYYRLGFTIPEIDTILEYYAEKSYQKYKIEYYSIISDYNSEMIDKEKMEIKAHEYAMKKTEREAEQGFQNFEYSFNTLSSSRGDYAFITTTFGLAKTELGKMLNKVCLRVRQEGQGKDGHKRPVLFPKLVFLYDKELHGDGKPLADVFAAAIECSSKAMYPDYLSLNGDDTVGQMYKQYGKVISPMGKRKL